MPTAAGFDSGPVTCTVWVRLPVSGVPGANKAATGSRRTPALVSVRSRFGSAPCQLTLPCSWCPVAISPSQARRILRTCWSKASSARATVNGCPSAWPSCAASSTAARGKAGVPPTSAVRRPVPPARRPNGAANCSICTPAASKWPDKAAGDTWALAKKLPPAKLPDAVPATVSPGSKCRSAVSAAAGTPYTRACPACTLACPCQTFVLLLPFTVRRPFVAPDHSRASAPRQNGSGSRFDHWPEACKSPCSSW